MSWVISAGRHHIIAHEHFTTDLSIDLIGPLRQPRNPTPSLRVFHRILLAKSPFRPFASKRQGRSSILLLGSCAAWSSRVGSGTMEINIWILGTGFSCIRIESDTDKATIQLDLQQMAAYGYTNRKVEHISHHCYPSSDRQGRNGAIPIPSSHGYTPSTPPAILCISRVLLSWLFDSSHSLRQFYWLLSPFIFSFKTHPPQPDRASPKGGVLSSSVPHPACLCVCHCLCILTPAEAITASRSSPGAPFPSTSVLRAR